MSPVLTLSLFILNFIFAGMNLYHGNYWVGAFNFAVAVFIVATFTPKGKLTDD